MIGARRSSAERRVVLLGNAGLGGNVVDTLAEQASLTVVTNDESWARKLEDRAIDVRVGDVTDETVLASVELVEATAVVVALDAGRAPYAVLATRRVDPDARVVVVTTGGHDADLAEIGADETIDPQGLLARTTAEAALGRETGSVS